MCHSILLSTNGSTTISFCNRCSHYYIWQRAFLLTFGGDQFDLFIEDLNAHIGNEEYFMFPDGIFRFMLHSPIKEIAFSFTPEEWRDFYATLQEATYMREVYQLIQ